MNDRFCLKWHNYKDNIVKSLTYLREEKNLFDVTLVSNDHKHISAHKLVLTASSEYFREVFTKSNLSQFQLMLFFTLRHMILFHNLYTNVKC